MTKGILILKVNKDKEVFDKGLKAWKETSHERKVLYEMMAHIINKINEYEGRKSDFKGFNVWMYKCQQDRKELEKLLGVI